MTKRVLLVDDEKDLGKLFKKILEQNDIMVDFFSNPIEALEHFRPGYYNLIILDIRMPQMNGTQLYAEIRKLDSKVPVCFISAYEMTIEELRQIIPDYISNCLMSKPIQKQTLVNRVQDVLRS